MMDNHATPASLNVDAFTPSAKPPQTVTVVTEEQIIQRLRRLMKVNLKNMCYQDAIFYADKLLHLQSSRTDQFVRAVYDLGKLH